MIAIPLKGAHGYPWVHDSDQRPMDKLTKVLDQQMNFAAALLTSRFQQTQGDAQRGHHTRQEENRTLSIWKRKPLNSQNDHFQG